MSAYPSGQREALTRPAAKHVDTLQPVPSTAQTVNGRHACSTDRTTEMGGFFDQLVDQVAEQVAAMVLERLSSNQPSNDDWLDCRHAAEYLGVHRDTLRKLAAERAIPSEQDGRGCKVYFRRRDLDTWRRGGGRPRHLSATFAAAA